MTENLPPRDSKGRFKDVVTDEFDPLRDDKTVGVLDESCVSNATEWVNVDLELLEDAIQKAKKHDSMVRLAVRSKQWEENGRDNEFGLVLLKGDPYESEVVALAGLHRVWTEESND
ncbi:hypothetical protein HFTV1-gp52 [Haloferax tailed virus 1]|uniref:Uncharacterized protein n=1 Tax=Haloferax tailed virus 1 TaxID=2507575 RepID=A0A410N728_HFTV1|nr:hypothetical protein M1M17_gp52 [Haloferax tailed virus 1]QAS68885.1 hypothetical protein HFTV1-gp52 [Haloferax tailed virus 1]